ncbi:MAG: hypothetical protein H0Z28_05565 [Archaeoglobus sp.]|nr:hypothetical protein [Archaeoglobus sp.]
MRERIGSDYKITGVEVMGYSICYMGCYPKAYPAVFIKSNPDPCKYGMDFTILVDLKEEKVADILSYYRKPSPECLNSS